MILNNSFQRNQSWMDYIIHRVLIADTVRAVVDQEEILIIRFNQHIQVIRIGVQFVDTRTQTSTHWLYLRMPCDVLSLRRCFRAVA